MSSSGSSSCRWRRTKPHLPLVNCPCCESRMIKVFTSFTKDNPEKDFYKCPNHQKDDSGCNFWMWEKRYKTYLEGIGIAPIMVSPDGTAATAGQGVGMGSSSAPPMVVDARGTTMLEEGRTDARDMALLEEARTGARATTLLDDDDMRKKMKLIVSVLKDIRNLLFCIVVLESIRIAKFML